jgi:hypothetical protein
VTEDRRPFNVGVVKLPEAERDVARSVFSGHAERFTDIMGADTSEDDERYPVGSHTAYNAMLTEREADAFSRASNLRYIEPDRYHPHPHAGVDAFLPRPDAQRFLQGEVAWYPTLTGVNSLVAVIDEGNTTAARATKNVTLVNRAYFMTTGDPTGEIWSAATNHGCLCMGDAVPYGGKVLDAQVIDAQGGTQDSWVASAVNWVTTQGAQVVNMSIVLGTDTSQVVADAVTAANSSDIVFIAAAGNENLRVARFPAALNQTIPYVHSVMSYDMSTQGRSYFSNYGPWHTGLAPGDIVWTTNYDGTVVQWQGTSAATPHVVQLVARIMSAGVSARQAAAALAATTRDLGIGADNQGGGAYSMQAALRWLNKEPAITITTPLAAAQKPGLPLW